MIDSNRFNGVAISGVSWISQAPTSHAPAAAAPHAAAAHAPMPRKRRTAAATLASVNRGTF
jgi:hypothetical protein